MSREHGPSRGKPMGLGVGIAASGESPQGCPLAELGVGVLGRRDRRAHRGRDRDRSGSAAVPDGDQGRTAGAVLPARARAACPDPQAQREDAQSRSPPSRTGSCRQHSRRSWNPSSRPTSCRPPTGSGPTAGLMTRSRRSSIWLSGAPSPGSTQRRARCDTTSLAARTETCGNVEALGRPAAAPLPQPAQLIHPTTGTPPKRSLRNQAGGSGLNSHLDKLRGCLTWQVGIGQHVQLAALLAAIDRVRPGQRSPLWRERRPRRRSPRSSPPRPGPRVRPAPPGAADATDRPRSIP